MFLNDIKDAITEVESFVAPGKEEFLTNAMMQSAVMYKLQTIGEAANNLPEEIKARCPEIPWKRIIGFRNIAAHTYWRIDMNSVWVIIDEGELAVLRTAVQQLIDEINASP